MSRKLIPRIILLISGILLLTSLAIPVLADGGGHLWFYSQDPDTLLGPQPLPNPQDYDPNWMGSSSDPWMTESVVIPADWETPFTIWLGCAQFESLGTKLVISINTAASAAITGLTVDGTPVVSWITSGPYPLPPHGVFNSAEFHGYVEVVVGNIYSPPGTPYALPIVIDIAVADGADLTDAKIHFDAYGTTESGKNIFSPFSHDSTFVIPELATVFLTTGSLAAFGLYTLKTKTARKPKLN